ncbi:glycosyltransferase family 2 protein [Fictibacillus nanhaiensis]|uniref:Glycosyltransferase family 2 protein n=1 Tax=Fictibacillus nanhaiensis TaxID=742169 RepID=A0ABS2ZQ66_9BACL|nr:glycosyltransferase family 2 protein [Fictibacillus nanhaiensis]
MKFSLIMATVGRENEVIAFLKSLKQQSYKDFELIIVDQNDTDFLRPIVEVYKEAFCIKHIRYSKKGLSLARNRGLQEAEGQIIAFPDDDCLYSNGLLLNVCRFFEKETKVDAISVAWHDAISGNRIKNFGKREGVINRLNIWTQVSSITLFIKHHVFHHIKGFDETLGVGPHSKWKGAEDKDFPLRLLDAGFTMHYVPHIIVYHPAPVLLTKDLTQQQKKELIRKTFIYSAAAGYVMKNHQYSLIIKLGTIAIGIAKTVLSILQFKPFLVRIRIASIIGRLHGFLN